MVSYLYVRIKHSIQSYASRMDQPTEEMWVPFLPPGVKESGREANSGPVMQAKGRKIWSQLKGSRGFNHFADTFSWLQCVLEEQLRGELTKTKLTGYERQIVKLISWKVAWKEGICSHFATAMMKFSWKNTRFDKGIKDCICRFVWTTWFKLKFKWEDKLIVLVLIMG